MNVAFQGEHGAYSEEAIRAYYGEVETCPCESFEEVFATVGLGRCEAGLIPIENTLAGSIHQNYDLLFQNQLHIVGEYFLRVRHCLIAMPGVKKSEIRKAISHPQALAQCAAYLHNHGIKSEQVYDTAGSVKMLKESGAHDTAAIASRRAADLYGMQILDEGIEDNVENYTRFLALAKESIVPQGAAKTSILFTLKNQPRALSDALGVFASHDIDITKIESRPLQGKPWEYLYFVDFIGAVQDEHVHRALDDLGKIALLFRVLGSYPRYGFS